MIAVTIIFLGSSLGEESCTLEQNMPISTTGTMLQDLNMMTKGKLVFFMASIEKVEATTTAALVIFPLLRGI